MTSRIREFFSDAVNFEGNVEAATDLETAAAHTVNPVYGGTGGHAHALTR